MTDMRLGASDGKGWRGLTPQRPLRSKRNHMILHPSITEKRIVSAAKKDDGIGFCIVCGKTQRFVEPDAEGYTCAKPRCAGATVFGAEQLLLMTVA